MMPFEQVCVIGLGLIGASLAQAIGDQRLAKRIVAVDKYNPSIVAARQYSVIQDGSSQLHDVVQGSDCIIIAVPVKAVASVLEDIRSALNAGLIASDCIISDVCSTKQDIVAAAEAVFTDRLPSGFVPAHPIAGAEHSGFSARNADLFVNHHVIVCPLDSSDDNAVAQVCHLWESVGAAVMRMEVAHHDEVLAYTSHLPHLLAFNLVDQLASHDESMDIFRYAAGGFRDFTRIAASDPVMWHDIFLANKSAVLKALDEYSNHLQVLRELIENESSAELLALLNRSQVARQYYTILKSSSQNTTNEYPKSMK